MSNIYVPEPPVLVTLTLIDGEYTVHATQEYREQFDRGHYKYVITNHNNDILSVGQSIAAGPEGRLDIANLDGFLKTYLHDLQFQ